MRSFPRITLHAETGCHNSLLWFPAVGADVIVVRVVLYNVVPVSMKVCHLVLMCTKTMLVVVNVVLYDVVRLSMKVCHLVFMCSKTMLIVVRVVLCNVVRVSIKVCHLVFMCTKLKLRFTMGEK